MAEIYPAKGPEAFAAMFEVLAGLVDDVRQIRATSDGPWLGVVVSDEVAEKYNKITSPAPAGTRKKGA